MHSSRMRTAHLLTMLVCVCVQGGRCPHPLPDSEADTHLRPRGRYPTHPEEDPVGGDEYNGKSPCFKMSTSPSRPKGRHPPRPRGRHPSVDRQIPVKTLPCPKVRLRAVMNTMTNLVSKATMERSLVGLLTGIGKQTVFQWWD